MNAWWSQTKEVMGNALDKWTQRNVRDAKILSGADFAESPVGAAMEQGEKKIRDVVEGTFEKMKPMMENLAGNIEKLRQQDLKQAAEVKVTMDENPLKQEVEGQINQVTQMVG